MIVYKDILEQLAAHGWSTYRLVKEKQLGNGTIQRIRDRESISTETLNKICYLCGCQPGDLIGYKPDKEEGD